MDKSIAIIIYIISGIVAATSQIMMKQDAVKNASDRGLKRLFHIRVIVAYFLMFGTIIINMIAMRYVPYKYTAVLATFSYIFVILLSRMVLKEKVTIKKYIGMAMILIGIFVFNLG